MACRMAEPEDGLVRANGIEFAYLEAGPADGPLALCMHGFPDSPVTWRHLMPVLAGEGYRVVAPWSRGLGPTSASPDGRYDPESLSFDLIALHHALGGDDRAVLVGHDWGALAGQLALTHPECPFRAAVLLAVPPLGAVRRIDRGALPRGLVQFSYAGAFQVPGVGVGLQRLLSQVVRRLWRGWSPGYEPTEVDIEGALDALAGDALDRQLRYYRALPKAAVRGGLLADDRRYQAPTLFLHGRDDGCIHVALAEAARDRPRPNIVVEVLDDVGHFLHLEQPSVVAAAVLSHLSRPAAGPAPHSRPAR